MLPCGAQPSDPETLPGPGIHTYYDMLRAFHFPHPTWGGAAILLIWAFSAALLIWIAWRATKDLRQKSDPLVIPPHPEQKRKDFRVPVVIHAELLPDDPKGPLSGRICDLSAGGAALLAAQDLPAHALLKLRFAFEEGKPGPWLKTQVIRSEPDKTSGGFILHCHFFNLGAEEEQYLTEAVMAREREMLRNR